MCLRSIRPAHVATGEGYFGMFCCQQLRVSVIDLRDTLEESLLCKKEEIYWSDLGKVFAVSPIWAFSVNFEY